jgi:hypothetical protein
MMCFHLQENISFFCILIEQAKKVLYAEFVDYQDPVKTFDREISLSFLNSPVLDPRQAVMIGKILMTAITLLFS